MSIMRTYHVWQYTNRPTRITNSPALASGAMPSSQSVSSSAVSPSCHHSSNTSAPTSQKPCHSGPNPRAAPATTPGTGARHSRVPPLAKAKPHSPSTGLGRVSANPITMRTLSTTTSTTRWMSWRHRGPKQKRPVPRARHQGWLLPRDGTIRNTDTKDSKSWVVRSSRAHGQKRQV